MPDDRMTHTDPSPRPAAAPLGTDSESGGRRPDPEILNDARHAEAIRSPDSVPSGPVTEPRKQSSTVVIALAAVAVVVLLAIVFF
jgi:hypothetical protein